MDAAAAAAAAGDDFVRTLLLLAVALGLFARLLLAWLTLGTNDAMIWAEFAGAINRTGLPAVYRTDPFMNHPPLPAYWAALCERAAAASGLSFWFLFKLPAVAADALACALLWRVWSGRAGGRWGGVAAAAFAWNLDAILVSGFHCNTDPVYAALALLAAHCVAGRNNFLAAGLVLGAAVNVKVVPLLLVPPLLSLCRSWRDAARFVAGLSVGAVPFLAAFALGGTAFLHNVLGYASRVDRWGIPFLLEEASRLTGAAGAALDAYRTAGRYAVVGAVLAVSLASWLRRRWDAYELTAATLALFLVLAPGFGVQYTVIVAPVLMAVSLRWGSAYGLLAGLFLLIVYWINWTGSSPAYADFKPRLPMPGALVGLFAWLLLAVWLVNILFRRRGTADRPAVPPERPSDGEGGSW